MLGSAQKAERYRRGTLFCCSSERTTDEASLTSSFVFVPFMSVRHDLGNKDPPARAALPPPPLP
ncbi:uncharacterized, partial [Tachysurus ichikawai]